MLAQQPGAPAWQSLLITFIVICIAQVLFLPARLIWRQGWARFGVFLILLLEILQVAGQLYTLRQIHLAPGEFQTGTLSMQAIQWLSGSSLALAAIAINLPLLRPAGGRGRGQRRLGRRLTIRRRAPPRSRAPAWGRPGLQSSASPGVRGRARGGGNVGGTSQSRTACGSGKSRLRGCSREGMIMGVRGGGGMSAIVEWMAGKVSFFGWAVGGMDKKMTGMAKKMTGIAKKLGGMDSHGAGARKKGTAHVKKLTANAKKMTCNAKKIGHSGA